MKNHYFVAAYGFTNNAKTGEYSIKGFEVRKWVVGGEAVIARYPLKEYVSRASAENAARNECIMLNNLENSLSR